jgi:hypothetical protein
MTAPKPIPLSEEERKALLCLCFIVRMGTWSWPLNPAFVARLTERLRASGAYDRARA